MELISVIIPVYNVESYLLRCVESIRKQTYRNLEIILVDDGSPDRCPQMCDELVALDSRIKVIHKTNGGLGFARNSGLDAASGDYIAFIDSDDWISEDHIENLYCAARRYLADVVIGSHTAVESSGEAREYLHALDARCYEEDEVRSHILLPLIGPDPTFPHDVQLQSSCCMNLYRMDLIRRGNIRFLSERYAISEDIYFNIDVLYRANRVVLINETGYYYFTNDSSLSRSYDSKMFERIIRGFEELKVRVLEYKLQEATAYRVERTFLMNVRVAIRLVAMSSLPWRVKLQRVREMLRHDLVQRVLWEYPIYTQGRAIRLLMWLMRRENVFGVYCLTKLRERTRCWKFMREVLRYAGLQR